MRSSAIFIQPFLKIIGHLDIEAEPDSSQHGMDCGFVIEVLGGSDRFPRSVKQAKTHWKLIEGPLPVFAHDVVTVA